MVGDAIAAMPTASRWARAEVAGAARAAVVPLAEVTALPGEVAVLVGGVAVLVGEVPVVPGEMPVVPGEVPEPPGGAVPVTTAWPVLSSWVRAEVTGVVMLATVPPSWVTVSAGEVTVPWPVAAS
jgi:hypothetical protein